MRPVLLAREGCRLKGSVRGLDGRKQFPKGSFAMGSLGSMLGACPICGCELSVETVLYRCWCCNRSFSYSEIVLLRRQTLYHPDDVRRDDELPNQLALRQAAVR